MFRSAKALDRAKTHSTFKLAMASYEKTAESWFDGTVDAVDRRIAQTDKLLHHIRTVVSRLDFADSVPQLRAAQTLSADRTTLVDFKRTLLTGAADYSKYANYEDMPDENPAIAGKPADSDYHLDKGNTNAAWALHKEKQHGKPLSQFTPDDWAIAGDPPKRKSSLDGLPAADKRWVTLESSRFVSANTDCLSDPEELATRAQHHAALKTSTFSRPHSAAVTRAFVSSVVELGAKQYRPPVVKQAAAVMPDVPDGAMFL
jgi:hypothetical protein